MGIQKNSVYVGDIGTELRFDIGVDSANVSEAKIIYRKPNGVRGEWIADIVAGTQEIKYSIGLNDLDVAGTYKLQPYVVLTSGWRGHGEIVELYVKDSITL